MSIPRSEPQLKRSPEARALAEQALVGLLRGLNDEDVEIVVLGGLVPEILTRDQDPPAPPHMGTTDVDLLLTALVKPGLDLSSLETSLRALEFEPQGDGWRWRGRVRGRAMKIEFLCDLETAKEHEIVRPPGCTNLSAQNLRGTGYVAEDWAWETISAPLADGSTATVKARFAKLDGYLLSKCVAARTRGADKDFYDLVYVLLHNRSGGPAQAAEQLGAGPLGAAVPALRSTLVEIGERFRTPNSVGAGHYARQAQLVEPETVEADLRADAVAAIAEFLDRLDEGTGFRAG